MSDAILPRVEPLRRAARSLWFRALVTLSLLALVAAQIDWDAAGERLAEGDWSWFAAAVAALVVALVVGAVRWHLLLAAAGVEGGWLQTLRAYAIGVFSNNFLPTSFGGDAARAWIVGRSGHRLVRAATSVVVDRVSALVCLVIVAWAVVALDPGTVPDSLLAALLVTTGAGLGALVIGAVAMRAGGGLARRLPQRVRSGARTARDTLADYGRSPRLFLSAFSLGVVFQTLTITAVWLLAKAIEVDLAFTVAAVAVPLVLVITIVPVSIAGFGVREGGFVVLLAEADIDATDATLLSLLSVVALAVSSLPGALAMVLPGDPGRPRDPERPSGPPAPKTSPDVAPQRRRPA